MSSSDKKVVCIVQARMGSTRLPGKIKLRLADMTVLEHVVTRLQLSKRINQVVVATTESQKDDEVLKLCEEIDVVCFRGSEENVLSRYHGAANKFNADAVVRVTSDCPLIDPTIIDEMIEIFLKNDYALVTNVHLDPKLRTFPRGLDAEVFSKEALDEAFEKAEEQYQKEHVTPYLYEHLKNIHYFKNKENLSEFRLTLDTDEDLKLISEIYSHLYKGKHDFFLNEINRLFQDHPELRQINANIVQKSLK